jgi:hypothetical protein
MAKTNARHRAKVDPIVAIDPIFGAIDAWRRADAACVPADDGDIPDELADKCDEAYLTIHRTRPTTPAGLAALTGWAREPGRLASRECQRITWRTPLRPYRRDR